MAGRSGSNRGFAGMDPARQREIARKGGQAKSRNRQSDSGVGRNGNQSSGNEL